MLNSSGPKILPWGTPSWMERGSETEPLITTLCLRSERYDLNQRMCFDDLGFPGFLEWLLDFVQDVLTHDVEIQLGFAFAVQTESSDFAFHVAVLGLVAIILGSPRYKFMSPPVKRSITSMSPPCTLGSTKPASTPKVILVSFPNRVTRTSNSTSD